MKTSARANSNQHPSLSGQDERAPCDKGSMVYNLHNLYKPGIWLMGPEPLACDFTKAHGMMQGNC